MEKELKVNLDEVMHTSYRIKDNVYHIICKDDEHHIVTRIDCCYLNARVNCVYTGSYHSCLRVIGMMREKAKEVRNITLADMKEAYMNSKYDHGVWQTFHNMYKMNFIPQDIWESFEKLHNAETEKIKNSEYETSVNTSSWDW